MKRLVLFRDKAQQYQGDNKNRYASDSPHSDSCLGVAASSTARLGINPASTTYGEQ